MKKFYLVLALSGIMQMGFGQAVDKSVDIPDLDNYQTLKCDFHMHTVFSDGLVWPTVRVDEAYAEGLDAIAIRNISNTDRTRRTFRRTTTVRTRS